MTEGGGALRFRWLEGTESTRIIFSQRRSKSIHRAQLDIDSPITATITIWKSSTISHRYNYPEILSTTLVNSRKNVPVVRSKKIGWKKKGNDLLFQNLARKLDSGWLSHTQSAPERAPVRSPSLSHVSREPSSYYTTDNHTFMLIYKLQKANSKGSKLSLRKHP